MGMVRVFGVRKEICLACTPEAQVGDYVLVHVGMAISVVDEVEAERMLDQLERIEQLETEPSGGPDQQDAIKHSLKPEEAG